MPRMTPATAKDWIGKELGVTDWFIVDQARIDAFADATLDHQFIHVDVERAKQGPFGGTIAHGLLTLSLLPYFVAQIEFGMEDTVMGLNYGFDKVRFLAPVKVNSRLRMRSRLLDAQEKQPKQFLIKQEMTIEIEGETKPALIAEWLTMAILR